jgi:hypothetical protein
MAEEMLENPDGYYICHPFISNGSTMILVEGELSEDLEFIIPSFAKTN